MARFRFWAVWLVTMTIVAVVLTSEFPYWLGVVLCVPAGYLLRVYGVVDKMLVFGDKLAGRTAW